MIKIHLSKILGERRIQQSDLAKMTGIRPSTINEWYHEIVVRVNLEHMDLICEALDISLDELMEYQPNKKRKTGKNLIIEEHGNRKTKK